MFMKKSQAASKRSASKTALGSMGSDFTSPPKTKVSPAGSTSTWAANWGHFGKGQKGHRWQIFDPQKCLEKCLEMWFSLCFSPRCIEDFIRVAFSFLSYFLSRQLGSQLRVSDRSIWRSRLRSGSARVRKNVRIDAR
jgi:hypothetical protein